MRMKALLNKILLISLISFISLTQTFYVRADDGFGDDENITTDKTDNAPFNAENTTVDEEKTATDTYNLDDYYYDGKIRIYDYAQLLQIGSNNSLYTSDGELIESVFYSSDSSYELMNDIELDVNNVWNASGIINNGDADEYPLYDEESDTIYIYNPYQLLLVGKDDEPVMSEDYKAAYVGVGQMIYPDGENNSYLTYSKSHRYVISKYFNSDRPETIANQFDKKKNDTVNDYAVEWPLGQTTDGRDFPGQVIKEIDGKTYILIGNEKQLRKIGTDAEVYGAVYQAILKGGWNVDTGLDGKPIMLYGGDADLTKEQNGKKDFTLGNIDKADSALSSISGLYTRGRCAVDQKTGKIDPTLDIENQTKLKYTKNANYIIFRDIDLRSENWKPITFQGTMIGAKSINNEKLWNDTSINTTNKPIISNAKVEQTVELNVGEQMGVGFFSTISSEVSDKDIGLSKGLVKVSNIKFENINVNTATNKTYYPESLVSALTKTLGELLGGLLSGLTFILTFGQVKIDLNKTLRDVLDARKKDPTALSTGVIAGRVEGEVELSNIEINKATVNNINNYTGGFIGYATGTTQYDGLSNALGGLVKLLSNILNVIPGLGLGDLITILLGNAIPLDKLIPTGYVNAKVVNCSIDGLNITTANDKDYAGGFVGMVKGTIIENSSIKNSSLSLAGAKHVGGFVGIARDDVIKGTLSGALDIQTKLPKMNVESMFLNCSLNLNSLTVSGETYIGGFAGTLANSSMINCDVTTINNSDVIATGDYAGGLAGISTIGWAADLGKADTKDNLLGGVVDWLVKLLSSDQNSASSLLSLAGVNPSYILGCSIDTNLNVKGNNYVGGITGRGNGVTIASSDKDHLDKISFYRNKIYTADDLVGIKNINVNKIESISGNNYVGGIAGSVGTASVAGLLNTTLGVARYLPFDIENVTVNGLDLFKVTGNDCVGGGLGEAVGGLVKSVEINSLTSVVGNNMVGGFVGLTGPGDLVGTDGGLTINLLGLNYLLKINNLLSVAEGIRVEIDNATVKGVESGFTVVANGSDSNNIAAQFSSGGFIARSNSTEVKNAKVLNLKEARSASIGGYSGGFIGISKTGGLADVADKAGIEEHFTKDSVIDINGLLGAISYLVPKYTNCTVTYVDGGGVNADVAGGFVGELQSGHVNNKELGEDKYYGVYNIDSINGSTYAGGFAGKAYSGALADAGKGISILPNIKGLNINIGQLLDLINVYVPTIEYAGIKSDNGFTVSATTMIDLDSNSGSAGGFIGYGSGVQVSHCDVSNLKNTDVSAPKDLEADEASTYFNDKDSKYAVTGARYAGGYIGYMNIGSAASIGEGLKVLGSSLGLSNILDALNVVVSTIEHSNVTGCPGGYAIRASWKNTASDASADDVYGDAGGFAGKISGGHIQDCNAYNFSYVVGQITAGGYVGSMKPGSVADVLESTSILDKVINIENTLASLLEDFVPTIRNSSTTCVPCGGAVRAQAESTATLQRGLAGGYVGHNEGGHIWGNDSRKWKGKEYIGKQSECATVRIRSIYGKEIAGGYTGLMESADTASTGNLSLLFGLIKVDNILSALNVIYPTQKETAIYGPLAKLDVDTWNSWVDSVGKYGGYGKDLVQIGKVTTQTELDAILSKYIYGYNVVAGRKNYRDEHIVSKGGAAGGYVGSMLTGAITNAQAHDAKLVAGARCAGGFAGEMINGGTANLGSVNILGLNLQLGQMLDVLQTFVPVIKYSSTEGYQSGLTVRSNGSTKDKEGYSGGYVGNMIGGQIWGEETIHCKTTKLRRVEGANFVGGFVGSSKSGSALAVNPTAGESLFLSKLLNSLLKTPADLIQVLNATVATIRYADVESLDDWGIVINGSINNTYAKAAGGFAGSLVGTVLGKKNTDLAGVSAKGIRTVIGGEYAGGFFGYADVAADVSISGEGETSLLKYLLKLGRTDVLDTFRTYVYYGQVDGSIDGGLSVKANVANKFGQNDAVTYSGNAGGFGGALLNSSVKNSKVTNLSNVDGINSAGGFIGYSGKSGVVNLDKIDVLGDNKWQLLGGAVGVLDVFGSHIEDSSVAGIKGGYTVQSTNGEQQIAGGFIGYADLSRMSNCIAGDEDSTIGLKQVSSGGIAGGFAGKTSYEYLGNIDLDSTVVNALLTTVNSLVKALYLDKLQAANLLNINLGIIQIKAAYEGDLLSVNLFGLKISVGLSKKSTENDQQTDLAIIRIGDSIIKLPCDENGIKQDNDTKSNISISLIKANRTKITNSKVYGIDVGYDVYAGGANYDKDGTDKDGISGGFVGFNNEGLLENNDMFYCDVVRGTAEKIGPFSGNSKLDSQYEFNKIDKIEGVKNNYRIYRKLEQVLDEIKKNTDKLSIEYKKDVSTGWDTYTLGHMNTVKQYDNLKDAKITDSTGLNSIDLQAYESSAKAVLMSDAKTHLNTGDSATPEPSGAQNPCDKLINLTINKVWKDYYNVNNQRPDSITVTISRTWEENGEQKTEVVPGYESYKISGSLNKATWQEVIEGLPTYKVDGTDETKLYYYTYSITEQEVAGYMTTIEVSKDGFTFTITNRQSPMLPETGGMGDLVYVIVGVCVILLAFKKKNTRNNVKRI